MAGPRTAIAVVAVGGDDVASAAVRSRYAPAGAGHTPAGKAANRRVEIGVR